MSSKRSSRQSAAYPSNKSGKSAKESAGIDDIPGKGVLCTHPSLFLLDKVSVGELGGYCGEEWLLSGYGDRLPVPQEPSLNPPPSGDGAAVLEGCCCNPWLSATSGCLRMASALAVPKRNDVRHHRIALYHTENE